MAISLCFSINVGISNQIDKINLFHSNIDVRNFEIDTTTLTLAPWYNPILNGYYIVKQNNINFIVLKTSKTEFIAVKANDLILITLTSPRNLFIFFVIFLIGFVYLKKELKKHYYTKKIIQLNKQTDTLLKAFNLQTKSAANANSITTLSESISTLNSHVEHYVKQTQTSIYQDKLTLLIDRHAYIKHIDRQISQVNIENLKCALLFIDLDGFKKVNDSFGHSFGDEILVQVATRLANVLRHNKLNNINLANQLEQNLSRLGGDEFSIFIESVESEAQVLDIARNVLNELEKDFVLGNKIIKISASIGIAKYPESASTPQALLQLADVAMYRAKHDGKGIFKVLF